MSHLSVVHTCDNVLHPGARHDFQMHVDDLVRNGKQDEAASLWAAVVEIQHLPVPEVPVLGGEQLGSMGSVVCTEEDCSRCKERRGGYRFPWLGRWCKQAVLRREAADPPTAWQEWSNCSTKLDLLQLAMHNSGLQKQDLLPPEWAAPLLARSMRHGGPGSWVLSPGWTLFQCQLLRGQRHWPAVGAGHTDLCWRGWMPTRSSCCHGLASCVVMPPGMSVAIAWKLFALTALRTHWHKVAQCLDKSFAARKWQQGKEFAAQPHLCGHPRVDVKLPKPSCNSSRLGEKVGALLMVGALVLQQQQVVSCGNDDRKPPLPVASGPSSSSQSPPPSQVGPARWAAVTALETAARERVLAWRLEKGLEDDADFAYRWASHEEAIAGAGHAVAHEWLRIRAEQVQSQVLPWRRPSCVRREGSQKLWHQGGGEQEFGCGPTHPTHRKRSLREWKPLLE